MSRYSKASLIIFCLMAVCHAAITAGNSSVIMLDAANYRLFNFDVTQKTEYDYTQTGTSLTDTVFSSLDSDTASIIRISPWGNLSSESGEPLFIRFKQSAVNKEHITNAGCEAHLFNNRIQIKGGYLHLGSYSDRLELNFASLSSKYAIPVTYTNLGEYAISEYYYGIWKYSKSGVTMRGYGRMYGNWVSLPVNYDPVYISGYRYNQLVSIVQPLDTLIMNVDVDMREEYPDHVNKRENNVLDMSTVWSHRLADNVTGVIVVDKNTGRLPEYSIKGDLIGAIAEKWYLKAGAGFYSNIEPVYNGSITWFPYSNMSVEGTVAYDYTPSYKPFIYTSISNSTSILDIQSIRSSRAFLRASVDTLFRLPLDLQCWVKVQYGNNEYAVNNGKNQYILLRENKSYSCIAGTRINGNFKFSQIPFEVDPWVQINKEFKGLLAENIPLESGLKIRYLSGTVMKNLYEASITYRRPYSLNLIEDGRAAKRESPELLFLNLHFRVPFISPILDNHLKPSVDFEFGPLHLINGERVQFHPYGNIAGPAVSVKAVLDVM
jgi:hypothetical protein